MQLRHNGMQMQRIILLLIRGILKHSETLYLLHQIFHLELFAGLRYTFEIYLFNHKFLTKIIAEKYIFSHL